MLKEKTVKCVLKPCKFNRMCAGCPEVSTPHFQSDARCKFSSKKWQSVPANLKKAFPKTLVKDQSPEEIVLICQNHAEMFAEIEEMREKLAFSCESPEFLAGMHSFKQIFKRFPELKEFLCNFVGKFEEIVCENPQNSEFFCERLDISLGILSFVLIKDAKQREKLRENASLIKKLEETLFLSEKKLRTCKKTTEIVKKCLFLLTNLNNVQAFPSELAEKLMDFSIKYIENEDFGLSFHLISLVWGLADDENIKKSLKKRKNAYFFKFFNENHDKMDLQFQELCLSFLLFIYREELENVRNEGEVQEEAAKEIEKFADFIEKNQEFYSSRVPKYKDLFNL